MRKLIVQLAVVATIVLIGFLALFKRDAVKSLFSQLKDEVTGFTPAKTPDEALDKFRKAIKQREYETAARYCAGPYAEQMRKAATAARELGKAIDHMMEAIEKRDLSASDRTKLALLFLEPFPPGFEYVIEKQTSDDKAYAKLSASSTVAFKTTDYRFEVWNLDQRVLGALWFGIPERVELRQEGKGNDKDWKIHFPVSERMQKAVLRLIDKYKDYKAALNKVSTGIRTDAVTKDDVDNSVKKELELAATN